MNCHEAERQILAGQDGAPEASERAALASHLAGCAACRQLQENLTATISGWRTSVAQVPVPDSTLEWQKVRREIRGGAGSAARDRRSPLAWFALPLAAAAAVAVIFLVEPGSTPDTPKIARTAQVAAPDENASTVVFVDDTSGWVFVWASDDRTQI